MKSDNTSKSKIWRYGKKSQSCQGRKERARVHTLTQRHTHTCTHVWINFTAAIEKVTSNMQPYRKPSLRRQRIKCEEQKHVNLPCPRESELLCCVVSAIAPLTLCCRTSTSSIRDDKCDMTAELGRLRWLQTQIYLQHSVQQGEVCRDKTAHLNPLMLMLPSAKKTSARSRKQALIKVASLVLLGFNTLFGKKYLSILKINIFILFFIISHLTNSHTKPLRHVK